MFEQLMEKFTEERNNLINKCTIELIKVAGFEATEDIANFELLMLLEDLKRKNYRISFERKNGKDRINLVKLEDLYEDFISGYEFDVQTGNNCVSIVANKIYAVID